MVINSVSRRDVLKIEKEEKIEKGEEGCHALGIRPRRGTCSLEAVRLVRSLAVFIFIKASISMDIQW